MSHLRIAAVQLEFQPVTRTSTGSWILDEPISSTDPLAHFQETDCLLASIRQKDKFCRNDCDKSMSESRQSYVSNITEKLREILTFCFKHKVDLVVFPEYSIPLQALDALMSFSNQMTIVAGMGYLQRSDISKLSEMGFSTNLVSQANNVAVLLCPDSQNYLISKKNPAEEEIMQSGRGSELISLSVQKGSFTLGVSICLDYIREKGIYNQTTPDMVIIPALSRNTTEFVQETPRDYLRIFANHSRYGGTYIGAPCIKGLSFANENGTVPLEKGCEGIVIVDWDFENPFPEKPSSTKATNHLLYTIAAIIYSGRDPNIAISLSRLEKIPSEEALRVEDLLQFITETRSEIEHAGTRLKILKDTINAIESGSEVLSESELRALSRHCLLSNRILSINEWRYQQCSSISKKLKQLQEKIPEIVAAPYGIYEKIIREIAKDVRLSMLDIRHKGTLIQDDGNNNQDQLILYANLGPYGEEAIDSLSKQLTMIRALSDLDDPTVCLRYRIITWREETTNILYPAFEVICTTHGKTTQEIENLRQGLGQLIHVTFTGAYSISYTTDDVKFKDALQDVRQSRPWWVEIKPKEYKATSEQRYLGLSDWGLIIDLLRSISTESVLELQCRPVRPDENIDDNNKNGYIVANDSIRARIEGSHLATHLYFEMYENEWDDPRRLSIQIFIGGNEALPDSVISTVGIELAGRNQFEIMDAEHSKSFNNDHENPLVSLSPINTLRVFHPPFGTIYRTSGHGTVFYLDMKTVETQFPNGISLGNSRYRHVRADEDIEVKLSDADRLRHVYVLGKTGTGKTNLLKNMAAQDVKVPGRGVTIIDPHGDLVDYVLREIPDFRLNEVILIDLARTDAMPVLNPLDLDKSNLTVRDRTIQELISLMRLRVFHEYTGPRFDELVRLVFLTMLDEGYPEPASFVEVPRFFMDDDARKAAIKLLKDPDTKRRWNFQSVIDRDPENGGLLHWVTSKFDDIARDSTLKVVIGGSKSTVNIEDIVQKGGILLVRIPEAVIGKQAADFIGSLILLQLRMAIIRRRELELGKLQHYHFVYVDEFQNFANTDFHTLVAEARKFNIGFTLANQNLEQLREFRNYTGVHEQRLINAIFGNVANFIVFGVGSFDARTLSDQIGVREEDIMRIGRYEALAKILINGFETPAFTLRTKEAVRIESPRNIETIETRMKVSCWVKPADVLGNISGRLDRVLQVAPQDPEPEWDIPRIFRRTRNDDPVNEEAEDVDVDQNNSTSKQTVLPKRTIDKKRSKRLLESTDDLSPTEQLSEDNNDKPPSNAAQKKTRRSGRSTIA